MTPPKNPSETAGVTAYLRAFAHEELYGGSRGGDWLARNFLPPEWAASIETPQARDHIRKHVMVPGMYSYITARTANFDDHFQGVLLEEYSQIVILGAGYDTRAFRFDIDRRQSTVFELDAPATQLAKRQCLSRAGVAEPAGLRYGAVDFGDAGWSDTLESLGHTPSRATAFFLEGLLMYLEYEAVEKLFASMNRLAAPGSLVVFDAAARSVVDGTGTQYGAREVMGRASEHGERFRSGIEPDGMEKFLYEKGFVLREHQPPKTWISGFSAVSSLPLWAPSANVSPMSSPKPGNGRCPQRLEAVHGPRGVGAAPCPSSWMGKIAKRGGAEGLYEI